MSLLMRDLSPFELQEEILKLLNQRLGQRGQSPYPYPPGAAHVQGSLESAFGPAMPGHPYAAYRTGAEAMALAQLPGFDGLNPATGFPGGDESGMDEGGMGNQPEAVPALFDPDEDEMPTNAYEACRDRCYQQLRRDILDCYKKRGARAKALCFAAANARYATCLGACLKYRK